MENNDQDEDYINTLEGKERYQILLSQVGQEKLQNWAKEQENLKNNLSNEDDPILQDIMYIGGMDISFDSKDKKVGISGLVILDYKSLEIVYEDYNVIKIDEPYVPGFLAFREVKHLIKLFEDLKTNAPQFLPQVILLDGNGILHSKGFGVACHFGVLADIATIGCSKSVFSVDGITKDRVKEMTKEKLKKKGDSFKLIGYSGRHWGYALKSSEEDEEPLIISMGNKITNETSLKIVKKMCKKRIPEPIKLADKITRRLVYARKKYGRKNHNRIWNWDLKEYLEQNKEKIHENLNQSIEDEMYDDELIYGEPIFRGRGERGRGRFMDRGRGIFRRGPRGRFMNFGRGRGRGGGRGRGRGGIIMSNSERSEEEDNQNKDNIGSDSNIDEDEEEKIRAKENEIRNILNDDEKIRRLSALLVGSKNRGKSDLLEQILDIFNYDREGNLQRRIFLDRGRGRGRGRGRDRGRGGD